MAAAAPRLRTGSAPEHPRTLPARLRRAAEAFLDYLRVERGASERTVEAYRRDVGRYLARLAAEGVASVREVRPADVAAALEALGPPGAAPATLCRRLAAVRHFHRFCLREGLAETNPAALVDTPARGLRLPKALTEDQVVGILEHAADPSPAGLRDRAMLELLYASGVRVSELVGLDVDDVDLERRLVRCLGKGQRERVVPLGRPAAEAVGRYLREGRPALAAGGRGSPALFLSRRGSRLTRQSCWRVVKRYAAAACPGAPVSPHAFRHSFATHLLARGADLRVVQEALGHARLSTTQVYTLVRRDTLRDVYEAAHPRGRSRNWRPGRGT